ncbi:MAG: metallophosphoesterase [Cellulosilyticaceae bacterium]
MKKWWVAIGGIAVGVLGYALIEPFRYTVKKYEIKHPNIPEDFEGVRIAFLADIHYGRITKAGYLSKIVNRVNLFRPDMVLLGGDYVTHRKYIEPCFDILSKLESTYGTFGVIGNHDVMEGLSLTEFCMAKAGIVSINNEALWIEKKGRIKIGGVGDLTTQKQMIKPTLEGVTKEDYVILMTHNPKYIYELANEKRIGLVLAGHTHGGQFKAIKHLGKLTSERINRKTGLKYLSGKYNQGKMDIIVSNGVGTAKFPFRFFTPPEVVMIELHKEKSVSS